MSVDDRFTTPGYDRRFPTPGVDTRFRTQGVDDRFPAPGLDMRFYETPDLFQVAGSRGFDFLPSDWTTLFQDTAGATPVTAAGQSVRRMTDRSGLGNHATQATAANAPVSCIFPSSGVRNRANGSADVGNAGVWQPSSVTNGVTVTKIASGFDTDGLPYADYTVVGTASADTTSGAYLNSLSRIAGVSGQTFTASFIAKIIGGTPPPADNGVRADVIGETAPTTFVEATTSSVVMPTVDTVITASRTLNNAATNQVRGVLSIITRNTATVNYTVRIKALQFERAAARSNYQFNYSAFNVTEAPFASVRGIQFNGVDQWMQTPAIDFSTSDEVTVVAGVRKLSDAARGVLMELTTGGTNRFSLEAPLGGTSNTYGGSTGGTAVVGFGSAAVFPSPDTGVVTLRGKISTDLAEIRKNGSQVALVAADQGTGNYANAVVYIGRRGGTSLPFNGVLTSLVGINRLLSANDLTGCEQFAANRLVAA